MKSTYNFQPVAAAYIIQDLLTKRKGQVLSVACQKLFAEIPGKQLKTPVPF